MVGINKKTKLATLGIIIFIVLSYLFLFEPTYSGLVNKDSKTLIFAHRGYGDLGPDNALISAQEAIKKGLDGVDVDGQLSSDGELMIFHDLSVDRLTHGKGRVSNLTEKELRSLDLNKKYTGPSLGAAPVSSFEDFVKAITPDGILMVELKVPGAKKTGIEERAIQIIEKYDAFDKVFLSSFNPLVLYRLKKIDPRVQTVFIFMDTNWNAELLAEIPDEDKVDLPWLLQQEMVRRLVRKIVKPDALSINKEVDSNTTTSLIKKGWPVFLWTPDEEQDILKQSGFNPYGIISDQPLKAQEILRQ